MSAANFFGFRFFSVLTTLLTVFSLKANAAVVYIDFNNNPEERQVLLQSTSQILPPEELVLIPEENRADSLNLAKLAARRDHLWDSYTTKSCSADLACQAVPSGECGDIYLKLRDAEDAASAAPKNLLNVDVIRAALQKLDVSLTDSDESIALFFSGHFGGGTFTGNLGSLSVADIKKVFSEFPNLRSRVSRLYLLGCYTNTYSQIQSLWRDAFPQSHVIAGFYGQSPKGDSKLNLDYISELIRATKSFDRVKTKTEFEDALGELKPFVDINVALSIGDFYQETGSDQLFVLSQSAQKSLNCHAALSPASLSFYESVLVGTEPVPKSTSDSQLRTYYTALRDHASCLQEADFLQLEPLVPNPDQVIRLILYKSVVANFHSLQGSDLVNFDLLLRSLNIEPALLSQQVDFNDRKALISWIKALQIRVGKVPNQEAAHKVLDLIQGLSDTLVDLRDNCVPFSWVEPGSREVSSCFRAAGQCGN